MKTCGDDMINPIWLERREGESDLSFNGKLKALTDQLKKQKGLTKREYFAAMAMQGMCADGFFHANSESVDHKTVMGAFTAVQMADALINELNKPDVTP